MMSNHEKVCTINLYCETGEVVCYKGNYFFGFIRVLERCVSSSAID